MSGLFLFSSFFSIGGFSYRKLWNQDSCCSLEATCPHCAFSQHCALPLTTTTVISSWYLAAWLPSPSLQDLRGFPFQCGLVITSHLLVSLLAQSEVVPGCSAQYSLKWEFYRQDLPRLLYWSCERRDEHRSSVFQYLYVIMEILLILPHSKMHRSICIFESASFCKDTEKIDTMIFSLWFCCLADCVLPFLFICVFITELLYFSKTLFIPQNFHPCQCRKISTV